MSHKNKNKTFLFISIFVYAMINGCSQSNSLITPTSITIDSDFFTVTTIPVNTITNTSTAIAPNCKIANEEGKLYLLSDQEFFAYGPSEEEIDEALADNFPEWANYEQNVWWHSEPVKLRKIIREASFQEKFALNSGVTLITLGESLDWRLPSNIDLFSQSLTIGERLVRLWDEYSHPDNASIRSNYPQITNGATYALYILFNSRLDRLQRWCNTYQQLFS